MTIDTPRTFNTFPTSKEEVFNKELLDKEWKIISHQFFASLKKKEKELVDRIFSGCFEKDDGNLLSDVKKRNILPTSKLVQIYNKRSLDPKFDFYKDFSDYLSNAIIPGNKTVGILDIRGSSKMDRSVLSEKMMKVQFIMNLLEEKLKNEGFSIITPSFGDDMIFSILGENTTYKDLAILKLLYTLLRKCGIDTHFFIDKTFISPEQFTLLIGKNSIHAANIGGVTAFCKKYFRLHKEGNISKYFGYRFMLDSGKEDPYRNVTDLTRFKKKRVAELLRKDNEDIGEIFTDSKFDELMLGKQVEEVEKMDETIEMILSGTKLGRMIIKLFKVNNLPSSLIEKYHAEEDIEIIKGGMKNTSIFFIDGNYRIKPLVGKEKMISGVNMAGEGSLLQRGRSLANADCEIKKGSFYLKIPHKLFLSIMHGSPLKISDTEEKRLIMEPEDMDYIRELIVSVNARRDDVNYKNQLKKASNQ